MFVEIVYGNPWIQENVTPKKLTLCSTKNLVSTLNVTVALSAVFVVKNTANFSNSNVAMTILVYVSTTMVHVMYVEKFFQSSI